MRSLAQVATHIHARDHLELGVYADPSIVWQLVDAVQGDRASL